MPNSQRLPSGSQHSAQYKWYTHAHTQYVKLLICPFFLSKNGQSHLLLFHLRKWYANSFFSSQLPDPSLKDPARKELVPGIQPQWRGSRGICWVAAVFPGFCMHTQTQAPWDRLHLMQTHKPMKLCFDWVHHICPVLSTQVPKENYRIPFFFFLRPHRKRFCYYIF